MSDVGEIAKNIHDLFFKFGHLIFNNVPYHLVINAEIVVNDHIAQTGNAFSLYSGMHLFQFIRQIFNCLADDPMAPRKAAAQGVVIYELSILDTGRMLNEVFGLFKNVQQKSFIPLQ